MAAHLKSNSQAAVPACDRAGRRQAGRDAVLQGAFESNGPAVKRWQLTAYGRLGQDTNPPPPYTESQFVTAHENDPRLFVCYFDGDFPASRPPPPEGAEPPPDFNRARVFVSPSGDAALDAAGYHDTRGYRELAVEPPPSV